MPRKRRRVELVKLETLMNEKDQNLLILAAKDNCNEVVQNLLDCDFDVDDEDTEHLNAMDHAWSLFIDAKKTKNNKAQDQSNKIMISLLNANSKFPSKNVKFDFKKCPKNVQKFAENCQDLRDYLSGENELPIEFIEKIKKHSNLCYFYDRDNESLLAYAAKKSNNKLIPLLLKLDLTLGNHEDPETVFTNIVDKFYILKKPNRVYAKEYPDAHIWTLIARSKIGNNDKQHNKRWGCVKDAFEYIDKNPICSEILKVAAAWKKLKIYFDFKNNSTKYLDPFSSSGTMGIIYSSGYIYIGAKNMTNVVLKYKVYGTLIHELCHVAVLLTFMNDFDPYPLGDIKASRRFNNVFKKSKKRMNYEYIIKWVFKYYKKEHQHSELIVRPMHIMMHYSQNVDVLKWNQEIFEQLFSYHKDVFEPLLEKTCKVLEILQDDREILSYSGLTEPMKAKILHTPLLFQGVETSLFKMFGKDEKITRFLSQQNMRDMLLKYNYKLDLASNFKLSNSSLMLKRKIIKSGMNKSDITTLDDIATEVRITKVFILSDIPGSGKTVALGDLACKLKQQNPSYWVTHVKLSKCYDHLKKYTDAASVESFLIDILNIEFLIDKISFKKLYSNGKVIFIFDGFDKISPDYSDKLLHILKEIKDKTNNQLWISTRPHCAEQIEREFGIVSYKFLSCVWDDLKLYILKKSPRGKFDSIKSMITFLDDNCDFDNPLMISTITELATKEQSFNTDRLDMFTMFKEMCTSIDLTIEKSKDVSLIEEKIIRLHKIYALKPLYEEIKKKYPNCELVELSIIQNEVNCSRNTKFDNIQRIGLITKSSTDEFISFIHKSLAEYKTAEYLVSIIFDEYGARDEDFKRGLDLMRIIAKLIDKYKILSNFIISGIYRELELCEIDERFLSQFNENITNIRNDFKASENFVQIIEFWSPFFKKNLNIFTDFWQENENENLLKSLLVNNKLRSPQEVINFLSIYFSRLEKINLKMVGNEAEEFNLNLIKLLDFMTNNFNNEEILIIFNKQFTSENMIVLMTVKTVEVFCTIIEKEYRNVEIAIDILAKLANFTSDSKVLNYLGLLITKILSSNEIYAEKLLFNEDKAFQPQLVMTIMSKNREIFNIFKSLYIKYKTSPEQLQNYFISHCNLVEIFYFLPNEIKQDVVKFIIEIFGLEKDKLLLCIEDDSKMKIALVNDKKKLKFFLNFIDNNCQEQAINYKKEVLFFKNHMCHHPVLRSALTLKEFNRIRNLYVRHKPSWEEIRLILRHDCGLGQLFAYEIDQNITRFVKACFVSDKRKLIDCMNWSKETRALLLTNARKFKVLEDFLINFFDNDNDLFRECMRKVTFDQYKQNDDYNHVLLKSCQDYREFKRILNIYSKYKADDNDLRNIFINFCSISDVICIMNPKNFNQFYKFILIVFGKEEQEFLKCNWNNASNAKLVYSKIHFEFFIKITKKLFLNNVNNAKICIQKVLFENNVKVHPIFMEIEMQNLDAFQRIKTLCEDYKDSPNDLQKLFESYGNLPKIFVHITNDIYPHLMDLASQAFNSCRNNILKCIGENSETKIQLIKNEKNFTILEKFSLEFFGKNKSDATKIVQKVLFCNETFHSHPLFRANGFTSIAEKKRFKILYEKYVDRNYNFKNIFKEYNSELISIMNRKTDKCFIDFYREYHNISIGG